jgi:uncharacterized protein (DUF885 family)
MAAFEVARSPIFDFAKQFDLKQFHAHSLELGPIVPDPFRTETANWDDR